MLCRGCKKPLVEDKETDWITFSEVRHLYRGVMINPDGTKRMTIFHSNDCFLRYWEQYLVETYMGNNIYCVPKLIDGNIQMVYIPYPECGYHFMTLEDCKARIGVCTI